MRRRGRLTGCLAVVAAAYFVLLLASHIARRTGTPSAELPPRDVQTATVRLADASLDVRLAWREWEADTPAAPAVLLHGSPGSHRDFERLAPQLAADRHVVAPDFPGFGASTHDVPDYSIRAHARYVLALLDQLGIEKAHLIGFSMGGGVALSLYDLEPERVASITLLSAIGVQELELLGSYHVNHLIHGAQLALLWGLREGFPHFGWLDDAFLGVPYARNFYDTDQRPLRRILRSIEPPVLIWQGRRDPLVPAAVAIEHHRIVPQSELELADADHFEVFRGRPELVNRLRRFLEAVDRGTAIRRSAASAERLAAARLPFDPEALPPVRGIGAIVLLLILALATLVSEDLTTIAAGLLVADGRLDFVPAAVACLLGIFIGDLLLFLAGRTLGRPALRLPPLRWWLSERAVEQSSEWFRRRGAAVVVLSRFMPGMRLPTYFAAGLLHTSFLRFAVVFLLAAAVWTPLLMAVSMWLGSGLLHRFGDFKSWMVAFGLALLLVWVAVRGLLVPLLTHAGRRELVGAWRRWTQFEFWPVWLFYPPVVLRVLWLGLKYRSPTLFTAANPGIPAGGFIGESKTRILASLGPSAPVPPWTRLPDGRTDERLRVLTSFVRDRGLDFPIVLKPDAGQRGTGVGIIRSPEEAASYLDAHPAPTLAQAYAEGEEFGVFWYRLPGHEQGDIFAITTKQLPTLTGDGVRTHRELVLDDDRAVAMARVYLSNLDPWRVPAAGERIRLTELGTHCRGAIFRDGTSLASRELALALDEIVAPFSGFCFGRFDLRVPSAGHLAAGRGIAVIELNGVTSEATNIYDPSIGLLDAYRILFRQWDLAFQIGAENRALGARVTPARALLRAALDYRRMARPRSRISTPDTRTASPDVEGG